MRCALLAFSLLVAALATTVIRADTIATITSADFTFAYGAAASAPTWRTTENTATCSSTTQGSFTFTPAPAGNVWSGYGPIFTNRTLQDGIGSGDVNGGCGCVKDSSYFTLPIVAKYTGAAPADVDTSNPGYQLMLEITNLSIYGGVMASSSPTTLAWGETTPGHTAASSSVTLTPSDSFTLAASYTHLVWNPDDYDVSGGLNDPVTRTFAFLPVQSTDGRYLDGLEIAGRVVLSYNAVPEPSAIALLATGLIGLLAYAWRKRR